MEGDFVGVDVCGVGAAHGALLSLEQLIVFRGPYGMGWAPAPNVVARHVGLRRSAAGCVRGQALADPAASAPGCAASSVTIRYGLVFCSSTGWSCRGDRAALIRLLVAVLRRGEIRGALQLHAGIVPTARPNSILFRRVRLARRTIGAKVGPAQRPVRRIGTCSVAARLFLQIDDHVFHRGNRLPWPFIQIGGPAIMDGDFAFRAGAGIAGTGRRPGDERR